MLATVALVVGSPAVVAQMNIALVPTADPTVFEFHWTSSAPADSNYVGIMNSVFSIRWDASAGGTISEDDFVNVCSNSRAPLLTNDQDVEVVGPYRYYTFRCDGGSALSTTCGFSSGQTRVLHRFTIVGISGCPNIGLTNDAYVTDLNRDFFVSVGGVNVTGSIDPTLIGTPFTVTPGTYGPACSTDGAIALGGTPVGGTWSGTGVTGGSFDPSAGTQTLTYTVTQGGCTVAANTTITVSTATTWYLDQDNDGAGDPSNSVQACGNPGGYVSNSNDGCPTDMNKVAPGQCGCGIPDTDSDSDGTANCNDGCPNDPNKIAPGICGCGTADTDSDSDGTADCNDGCPNDPNKIVPGVCGCGTADTDSDSDGTADCNDGCPN
ncbi:MAG: hypothetical protein KDC00_02240, partial [Flavobacteriales bacterium]|nr:hypothetical protein [Flavobacteriales bacterium]